LNGFTATAVRRASFLWEIHCPCKTATVT
jgi:hypothetical protein